MSSPQHGKPGRDPNPSTPQDSRPLGASALPDEANRILAAGGTPGTTRPLADPTPRFGAGPRRIGVPPLAAAAPEPPPADHEPGPDQALPPPPWYRRRGILIAAAFAALIAEVGITVSGPGEPGTAPGGTTGTSTPRSASFSLIATGWWTPDPAPPPAAPPPAPEPPAAEPPVAAPHTAAPPVAAPPVAAPPPPPPSELVVRDDGAGTTIVSITNNAGKPPVGCVFRTVAVAGAATAIGYTQVNNFTVTGSDETRLPPQGPATGSTFHDTVTCDNGLSASHDGTF
jgi:hypothetical protein